MKFVTAVYENGIFRPTAPVTLPEGTTVLVQTGAESLNVRELAPPGTAEDQLRIYEYLAKSYETGDAHS